MNGHERLASEVAAIDDVDSSRSLAVGALSPRQRLAVLVDDGTWLEVGRLARSQQPSAEEHTPADGLITGWAKIAGREAAVIVEDPLVLARTDGQVAENKRQRLIATAAQRGAPLVAVIDGPAGSPPEFGGLDGRLFGHLADAGPGRGWPRPLVAVTLGPVRAAAGPLVAAADAVLAADPADGDERALLARARELVAMAAPAGRVPARLTATEPERPFDASTDDADLTPQRFVAGVADGGTVVALAAGPAVQTGVCRVDGLAVAYAACGGEVGPLAASDVALVRRAARTSRHFGIPLLLVQDTPGMGGEGGDLDIAAEVDALVAELRRSPVAKLVVVTGRGQVTGTFPLGGRQLGVDYVVAWPWATMPIGEDRSHDGPWLAAGMGLVDDVITPEETRDRLARMVEILAPATVQMPLDTQRRGRIVDDISKV